MPVHLTYSPPYKGRDSGWEVDGWWLFAPDESLYLTSNGNRIETSGKDVYYYAETTDGSDWEWSGESPFYFENEQYQMKKISDEKGDVEWAVGCSP